jgi:ubiquinone/menaquinone biosynthesis C-methylase UbiE
MEWVMAGEEFCRMRTDLLVPTHGDVLELGIGTGLNLLHYPETVRNLYAVDPAVLLPKTVLARSACLPFPVHIQRGTAEAMTHPNQRFDYVISTWTLCTIPDPMLALQEIGRVLKPEGRFLFLEHGRSNDQKIATWQDRLNPIQNVIGCGCHLNRRIDRLITQAGLNIARLDRFCMQGVPRLAGEMYRGTATRHH